MKAFHLNIRLRSHYRYLFVGGFICLICLVAWLSLTGQLPFSRPSLDNQQLIAEVSQLIELPNETPTIATVSNVDSLLEQPFFAAAQAGDRVLIYAQAKKAILYRPSTHKLIEVSSLHNSK